MAPALIKTKGASDVAKNSVSLVSSKYRLHTFFGGGQVSDKGKQYSLYEASFTPQKCDAS